MHFADLLSMEDAVVARSEQVAQNMVNEIKSIIAQGLSAIQWEQAKAWDKSFLRKIRVTELEKLKAIQEKIYQKALNIKLLHEVNELRKELKMEEYPDVPDHDKAMKRKVADF